MIVVSSRDANEGDRGRLEWRKKFSGIRGAEGPEGRLTFIHPRQTAHCPHARDVRVGGCCSRQLLSLSIDVAKQWLRKCSRYPVYFPVKINQRRASRFHIYNLVRRHCLGRLTVWREDLRLDSNKSRLNIISQTQLQPSSVAENSQIPKKDLVAVHLDIDAKESMY